MRIWKKMVNLLLDPRFTMAASTQAGFLLFHRPNMASMSLILNGIKVRSFAIGENTNETFLHISPS
jgi:hypothetical protein